MRREFITKFLVPVVFQYYRRGISVLPPFSETPVFTGVLSGFFSLYIFVYVCRTKIGGFSLTLNRPFFNPAKWDFEKEKRFFLWGRGAFPD